MLLTIIKHIGCTIPYLEAIFLHVMCWNSVCKPWRWNYTILMQYWLFKDRITKPYVQTNSVIKLTSRKIYISWVTFHAHFSCYLLLIAFLLIFFYNLEVNCRYCIICFISFLFLLTQAVSFIYDIIYSNLVYGCGIVYKSWDTSDFPEHK